MRFYRIYKGMYSYDRTPLNAKLESVAQDSADWRKEKVTFDAAYGRERVTAYLFVPAHVRPPYQSVVFFPSARAVDIPSSQTLTDMKFIDYVIQSGRAVVYPVMKARTSGLPPRLVRTQRPAARHSSRIRRILGGLSTIWRHARSSTETGLPSWGKAWARQWDWT